MGLSIKHIEEALANNGGFVSKAAKTLGVTPQAIYLRIKESERLQITVDNVRNAKLDLAEDKLMALIEDSNLGAICFYLKCQGKGRGYVELKDKIEVLIDNPVAKNIVFQTIDARIEGKE